MGENYNHEEIRALSERCTNPKKALEIFNRINSLPKGWCMEYLLYDYFESVIGKVNPDNFETIVNNALEDSFKFRTTSSG